jgi:hypothetical protein
MNSRPGGVNTSLNDLTEITAINAAGFWLLVNDREYFVAFADYPAFRRATVAQIYTMQQRGSDHFYWPDLDVDIELEALEQPERFPLVFAG